MTSIAANGLNTKRSALLGSACCIALMVAPGLALAQPATGANDQSVETVTVTGSRVIANSANSPTPLTVVSAEQLLTTTPTNISDGLNKLPVFQNSSSERNSSSGGGNNSGDFLNLRNFGQQRTLVLMDGMRVPGSNQNGSVD